MVLALSLELLQDVLPLCQHALNRILQCQPKLLTVFQLVTLPVEFDASKRAKAQLVGLGIVDQDELVGVTKTLDAAAYTYVAAFVSSLGWLLYFLAAARR